MAENERLGRKPHERITIKQDTCNLLYGVGECPAGKTNLFPVSEIDAPSTAWPTTGGYVITRDLPGDPTGGNFTIELLFNDDTSDGFLRGAQDVPQGLGPDEGTIYYTFHLKYKDGSAIDRFYFYLKNSTGAFSSLFVDLGIGGAAPSISGHINAEFFDAFAVEQVGTADADGHFWAKVTVSMLRSDQADPAQVWLYPADGALEPPEGAAVFIYGLTASTEPNEGYAATTGTSRTAISKEPCNNTRATCQAPEAYDLGTLPLLFCKPGQEMIIGEFVRPSVQSISITPGKINPGGANKTSSAFGERATLEVTFKDHPDSDRGVDLYIDQRPYDPIKQGTMWTKWRARNPYYNHREIVYESGYIVDGQFVDVITRTFFIVGFQGPSADGMVRIRAADPLTFASNDKAQAPAPSNGKLNADITAGAASATLTPTGIGDLEYPSTGFVRIGDEVIAFTRAGDVLTLDTRGARGTDPDEHDQGDTVQLCLEFFEQSPQEILYTFFKDYARIPDSFLDKAQWDAEQLAFLPNKYSALITEPVGIAQLVGEMSEQMYFSTWFDERSSLVKIRAVRPAEDDPVTDLNDDRHLVKESIQWTDKTEELLTQVWVYYGIRNPTEKLSEPENYAAREVIASPSSEGVQRNNIIRVKRIYSRWIPGATGGGAALDLGARILARYASPPRECSFSLDAKDGAVWLGDFVRIKNRQRTDRFGNAIPVNLQVLSAQEVVAGTIYSYTAQEFVEGLADGDAVVDPNVVNLPITADLLNVNLRDFYDSARGDDPSGKTVTFTIRDGIFVGGYATDANTNIQYDQRDNSNDIYNSASGSVSGLSGSNLPILQRQGIVSLRTTARGAAYPGGGGNCDFEVREYPVSIALDTGLWPVDTVLNLVIEGGANLLGEGGNGSAHGLSGILYDTEFSAVRSRGYKTVPGADGGHALRIQHPINITNGGTIASGGGGGGAGLGFGDDNDVGDGWAVSPGGGAAGFEISDVSALRRSGTRVFANRQPSVGSTSAGGSGGVVTIRRENPATSFDLNTTPRGGSGGRLAANGARGRVDRNADQFTSGNGGVAGLAIVEGADLVTWINKGDVRGEEEI